MLSIYKLAKEEYVRWSYTRKAQAARIANLAVIVVLANDSSIAVLSSSSVLNMDILHMQKGEESEESEKPQVAWITRGSAFWRGYGSAFK